MNTQVTATGMNVKAQAEGGIIISNEDKQTWNANATASHQTLTELIPTSSANMTTWYHAMSDQFDNAKANQDAGDYANCNNTNGVQTESNGVGVWTRQAAVYFTQAEIEAATSPSDPAYGKTTSDIKIPAETSNIYLLNKFYIKSSADAINDTKLYINNVTVTGNANSENLDKAMRVAIVIGNQTYIFAAFDGATLSYKVAGSNDSTTARAFNTKNVETTITSIPSNTSNSPIEASIYIYFEGEDANCKSSNITASLDSLNVSVRFGTTAVS